ncbi:MAG: ABC transporter ATP-binding protein [Geminicoccaceae bacterium]|nr:ABC transporter ATP-binding protein [Geminicoccaceae bacterium]
MALLEIEDLSVTFPTSSGPFRAVEGVDLAVDQGEFLGVVGESGSGKSVTMLALMGLLPPQATIEAKRLVFEGRDLRKISSHDRRRIVGREIAMIFQEPMSSLNPCFTVGFQIREALGKQGLDRAARRRRAVELLDEVGIPAPEERLSAFPHQLSGGMSQRVMIAMMLAGGPRLLVADEPTTALDVTIQAQILDLLRRLQRDKGMALILITHDMAVVAETAERVLVMYAGQPVEEQAARGLFARPRHPYAEALLEALPERGFGKRRLPTIPGVVPGALDRPKSCVFHPRCRYAQDDCRTVRPPFAPLHGDPNVRVRCFHPRNEDARVAEEAR